MNDYLVEKQYCKKRKYSRLIAQKKPRDEQGDQHVGAAEQHLQCQQIREIFGQQIRVLTDMPVVETLDTKIIDNLRQVGQIEQRKIESVPLSQPVLHPQINTKDEQRLDQQVDQHQQDEIEQEFAFHSGRQFRGGSGRSPDGNGYPHR
ncbi:MAG: hypothetical protein LW693_09570 [Saprospiraceae bacterium]|nr:hypothetical protein [Saprospiraceae bacterium]